MHELGESQAEQSAKIGTLALELGIDHLVVVNAPEYGSPEGSMSVHHRPTIDSALDLLEHFAPGDVVLVKASRSEQFQVLASELERLWLEKVGAIE
jgi:UDP-N-acetylmuramoyl-tripeptide--D-alanyl-D-alanine ligase